MRHLPLPYGLVGRLRQVAGAKGGVSASLQRAPGPRARAAEARRPLRRAGAVLGSCSGAAAARQARGGRWRARDAAIRAPAERNCRRGVARRRARGVCVGRTRPRGPPASSRQQKGRAGGRGHQIPPRLRRGHVPAAVAVAGTTLRRPLRVRLDQRHGTRVARAAGPHVESPVFRRRAAPRAPTARRPHTARVPAPKAPGSAPALPLAADTPQGGAEQDADPMVVRERQDGTTLFGTAGARPGAHQTGGMDDTARASAPARRCPRARAPWRRRR